MRFIGDVHGKFKQYREIIRDCTASIQVGDMGVGFVRKTGYHTGETYQNPPHYAMVRGEHLFIRGNHDNPSYCLGHSQFIPDGTIKRYGLENTVMFVGGALSIDREWRTEGYDWWPDEELSIEALYKMYDKYMLEKPRIMVTHDCPEVVAHQLFGIDGKLKFNFPSRTRQALQSMFEGFQPEMWIFGHWHESKDIVIKGTRFICLAELEHKDIDI